MKRTYTGTLFQPELTKAKVLLIVYEYSKYDEVDGGEYETEYTGVTSWDIIEGGEEAEEIEKRRPRDTDEYHEYLVLHFANGSKKTFKNSYVNMFVM